MNSINEKSLKDYPSPIFLEGTKKILRQMEKSIFKICLKNGNKGTGFFGKIPLPNGKFLPGIITNNHVIDEKYLNNEKEVVIKMNDGQRIYSKSINIKKRFYYTDKEYDITVIEYKEQKDEFSYEYLEFDTNIINDTGLGYVGNSIYLLHYPSHFEEEKVAVSYGILKGILSDKPFNFIHYCSTEFGSSGSPILNILNNKVIGIHKNRSMHNNYNIGLFLHHAFENLIIKYNNKTQFEERSKSLSDNKNKEILIFFKKLYDKKIISSINLIKEKNKDDICGYCYQLVTSQYFITKNIKYKNWIPAWHGTDYKYRINF